MTKQDFLRLLGELLEEEPDSLTGKEALKDLEPWDSLAVMEFLALVDEHFEMVLQPKHIAACETVADLMALLGDKVTG